MTTAREKRKSQWEEIDPLIIKQLWRALVLLILFTICFSLIGYYFEEQLLSTAQYVVNKLGFLGLSLILLVTDSIVSPFPPDLLLVIIAKSSLQEHWYIYVPILGIISTLCGMIGWSIGRWLGHFSWAQRIFGEFQTSHRDFVKRNGTLAVVVGALTPIPFSITCWAAGLLKLPWQNTLLAASLRIPRFLLYYILIAYFTSFLN